MGLFRRQPKDAYSWEKKGTRQMSKGRYTEALECFSEAINLEPRGQTFFCRYSTLYHLGRFKEALADLEKSRKLGWGPWDVDPDPWLHLADLLARLKHPQKKVEFALEGAAIRGSRKAAVMLVDCGRWTPSFFDAWKDRWSNGDMTDVLGQHGPPRCFLCGGVINPSPSTIADDIRASGGLVISSGAVDLHSVLYMGTICKGCGKTYCLSCHDFTEKGCDCPACGAALAPLFDTYLRST